MGTPLPLRTHRHTQHVPMGPTTCTAGILGCRDACDVWMVSPHRKTQHRCCHDIVHMVSCFLVSHDVLLHLTPVLWYRVSCSYRWSGVSTYYVLVHSVPLGHPATTYHRYTPPQMLCKTQYVWYAGTGYHDVLVYLTSVLRYVYPTATGGVE